jgi:hypothetical protein
MVGRKKSDEHYVIDLCDELLGVESDRQKRFDFLLGDPNAKGHRRRLPVDAYYPSLSLAIEYYEKQHGTAVRHFDKPHQLTVSGVHRGEQRRIYDARRREILPPNGIKLLVISYSHLDHDGRGRLRRNKHHDLRALREALML